MYSDEELHFYQSYHRYSKGESPYIYKKTLYHDQLTACDNVQRCNPMLLLVNNQSINHATGALTHTEHNASEGQPSPNYGLPNAWL